jgi:hypothetical protein
MKALGFFETLGPIHKTTRGNILQGNNLQKFENCCEINPPLSVVLNPFKIGFTARKHNHFYLVNQKTVEHKVKYIRLVYSYTIGCGNRTKEDELHYVEIRNS